MMESGHSDPGATSKANAASQAAISSIGVVGLGLIGSVICKLLLKSGAAVIGWDIDAAQRDKANATGVRIAQRPQELAAAADIIFLCLPHDGIAREFLAAIQLRAGQMILDTSTGAAAAAEAAFVSCQAIDVAYVDATISGSSVQLAAGQAVLMVGASDANLPRAFACLQRLGSTIQHVGPPGAGARMKLVTNLVLGLNRAALAEGLALAAQLGLNLELTLTMFRATPAYSRIMDTKGEKMIRGDFTPQARLSQHLKDVRLMLDAAGDLPLPLTNAHRQILEHVESQGYGDSDNSALIKFYQVHSDAPVAQ